MTVKKVERMAVENDFNGIVLVMLTEPDDNVARVAGRVFKKMVWDTLCLGAGWDNLFTLCIDISSKIFANPPLDKDRAEYAFIVYSQGLSHIPSSSEFERRPILYELLESVQQTLLKLYIDGGDYFRDSLIEYSFSLYNIKPLYAQKLYVQFLQEGKSLRDVLDRCSSGIFPNSYDGCESLWCIYEYINKKRDNILQKDKEIILSGKLRYSMFFSIECVKKYYLRGASDDTKFITYFEEQYIKKIKQ